MTRLILTGLVTFVTLWAMPGVACAQIFVTNFNAGTIGEYTTLGLPVNSALITGLSGPRGIAIFGGNLFVTNLDIGTIGEYTTSGVPVNPALTRD